MYVGRARLNHPTALKRRYEATHGVAETKGAKPQKVAHEQEVERLKAAVEMRDREIDWPKTTARCSTSLPSRTRSLASFSKTLGWRGPGTSAPR
jgi:hypothetical protein